jgi:transposase InsO family protein
LLIADFTYVKLLTGTFAYVAFIIDAFAGTIIGWEAATSKETRFVESAIRQAAALRSRRAHRSTARYTTRTRRSQYTAVPSARRCRCPVCGPRSGRTVEAVPDSPQLGWVSVDR